MILKLLLNIRIIWTIFKKTLKNTIQVKKCEKLTMFDDMISGMFSNENLNRVVTELFIRDRKLNISIVFII